MEIGKDTKMEHELNDAERLRDTPPIVEKSGERKADSNEGFGNQEIKQGNEGTGKGEEEFRNAVPEEKNLKKGFEGNLMTGFSSTGNNT